MSLSQQEITEGVSAAPAECAPTAAPSERDRWSEVLSRWRRINPNIF